MRCVQQAGRRRPADGAPLERGVMHQPTPSHKVHFPGLHNELSIGRPEALEPRTPRRPPFPSLKETNPPLGGRPNELNSLAADRPARRCATLSDRRATPPPQRQHAASAAGPTNMMVEEPRPDAPPDREQLGGPFLPYSPKAAALSQKLSKNQHSWLFWMSMSGGDPGRLF